MKRGFICLLIVGLAYAADDNVGIETKDININFHYDKSKRGATKLTNADSPSFNYLSASNTVSGGFKPINTIPTNSNAAPVRFVYNQQYYQPNPYLTYVQFPQAAQIAAQYSFQSNPVAHFLQTPTQIQYVAAPTVAQAPQIKYQEYSSSDPAGSETSAASASSQSQPVASPSQSYVSQATSQVKQVPLFSNYQSVQPVFYQQPLFTYLAQPQAANFIYQQPNLLKQQQLAGFYGANKLKLYTPTQNAQLTYTIVPMTVTSIQDSTGTIPDLKTSDKTSSHTQQNSSFNYGTKS